MKNISKTKNLLEVLYAKKFCNIDNISLCKKSHCSCSLAAELRAYIETTIPSPYYNFSIKDLTGKNSSGSQVLDASTVFEAKSKLLEYGWNKKVTHKNLLSLKDSELDENSIIDTRFNNGESLIIYSGIDSTENSVQQKGKTFIASIIMKEAIKRRIIPGNLSKSYGWIKYGILKHNLSSDNEEDIAKVSFYKNTDWLVIDDIPLESSTKAGNNFRSSLLDTFFLERIESQLPTIFVFRFNINDHILEIEESYGTGIHKIVTDKTNFFIKI